MEGNRMQDADETPAVRPEAVPPSAADASVDSPKTEKRAPMLDVHAPHEPILGWRDFLVHLFTITVGLLIALSLEGMVEWFHHRHLVHEAETSLYGEIQGNAKDLKDAVTDLHKQRDDLKHDVVVLNQVIRSGKTPEHEHMEIAFHIKTFDNLGWKTAQATGAAAYMPYANAQEYAGIYATQDELAESEKQAARDAILSLAPFMDNDNKGPNFTAADAKAMKEKIEILEGQILLVDSLMSSLDQQYTKFLAAHSEDKR
jgi:hypothetical protein